MANFVSFEELDLAAGELLPERAVLSAVVTPVVGNGGGGGGDGHGGTTILSSCQNTNTQAYTGLVQALGLGVAQPGQNQSCTPAAISGH